MTARSSGFGIPTAPFSAAGREAITPRFLVRITIWRDSIVDFANLAKSLSETISALASEWAIIISSSSVEKSGRIGTATMPAEVTARYETHQLGMLLLNSATLSPAFKPAPIKRSCTCLTRVPTSA